MCMLGWVGMFGEQVTNSCGENPWPLWTVCIMGVTDSAQGGQGCLHREGTFIVQLGNRETTGHLQSWEKAHALWAPHPRQQCLAAERRWIWKLGDLGQVTSL